MDGKTRPAQRSTHADGGASMTEIAGNPRRFAADMISTAVSYIIWAGGILVSDPR